MLTPASSSLPRTPRRGSVSGLTPRERLLVDAIAERVSDIMRSEAPGARMVDAATLAGALGVDRSYVYAHAEELGAVRLGGGPKPRLRFDLEASLEAFTCYVSKQSQRSNASTGAESGASTGRQARRLPNRLPKPGSVLAVRPRGGA